MPDAKTRPTKKPAVNPDRTLTTKQRDFVRHLSLGETVPTAALRAGYEIALQGYETIRLPHVKAAYEAEKRKYEEASNMTRAKVMEQFAEAYAMAKLVADPHAMVNATKEAAKMLGYYEPVRRRVEITVNGSGRSRELAVMSNEELAKLVDGATPEFQQELVEMIDGPDEDDES